MLDTVLVVKDSIPYDPLNPRKALEGKVPEAFPRCDWRPVGGQPREKPRFSGLRGGQDRASALPWSDTQRTGPGDVQLFPCKAGRWWNGLSTAVHRKASGQGQVLHSRKHSGTEGSHGMTSLAIPDALRCLWRSLAAQVRKNGLVLGTRAEPPLRRP